MQAATPSLSTGRVLAYGLLGLPLAFAALPIYVHVPRYYADTAGMELALLGSILLGARLLDLEGRELDGSGGDLARLERIDVSALDPRLAECRIEVACDVDNPLTGARGASAVFGPQKGATPEMVQVLDANLARLARIVGRDLGVAVDTVPGAGAAGGMGAAMLAFFGATLKPGIEIVTAAVDLDTQVRDADLVITGEGRIDFQTVHGKTPIGVARVAKRHGKPVIGIAGSLGADVGVVHAHGIDAVFSVLGKPCTLDEALRDAAANVQLTARNVAAVLRIGARPLPGA